MSARVWLCTNRNYFERAWRAVWSDSALTVDARSPDAITSALTPHDVLVVDAAAIGHDEDETLMLLAYARARGIPTCIELDHATALNGIADLVDDLCGHLVVRSEADRPRVAAALARRAARATTQRFEYLTVAPDGSALLAVFGGGVAAFLTRPLALADDGTEIASITLAEDASYATVELASGTTFALHAASAAASPGTPTAASPATDSAIGPADVNGSTLGARLRALRQAAGLTQAELARRTGIHRPNIARVEAGRHTPSLETLARLAAAIGVPTTRILTKD